MHSLIFIYLFLHSSQRPCMHYEQAWHFFGCVLLVHSVALKLYRWKGQDKDRKRHWHTYLAFRQWGGKKLISQAVFLNNPQLNQLSMQTLLQPDQCLICVACLFSGMSRHSFSWLCPNSTKYLCLHTYTKTGHFFSTNVNWIAVWCKCSVRGCSLVLLPLTMRPCCA